MAMYIKASEVRVGDVVRMRLSDNTLMVGYVDRVDTDKVGRFVFVNCGQIERASVPYRPSSAIEALSR